MNSGFRQSVAIAVALLTATPLMYAADGEVWPLPNWSTVAPTEAGLDEVQLQKARDYALSGGGAGFITRAGRLVMSNSQTGGLYKITILHLATQTAGFEKPGGYEKLTFAPGSKWAYSDGGPNWLAECVTLSYKQDVDTLMFDRVFTPLGISRADLVWRNNSYRDKQIDGIARREFGSGISANVDAMARVGLLYLRRGMWKGKRILPVDFVKQAGTTVSAVVGLPEVDPENYGNASDHYGLLWWNNADGTLKDVPRDAYWSWGDDDNRYNTKSHDPNSLSEQPA